MATSSPSDLAAATAYDHLEADSGNSIWQSHSEGSGWYNDDRESLSKLLCFGMTLKSMPWFVSLEYFLYHYITRDVVFTVFEPILGKKSLQPSNSRVINFSVRNYKIMLCCKKWQKLRKNITVQRKLDGPLDLTFLHYGILLQGNDATRKARQSTFRTWKQMWPLE